MHSRTSAPARALAMLLALLFLAGLCPPGVTFAAAGEGEAFAFTLPFAVTGAPGDVALTPLEGSPEPSPASFERAREGVFTVTLPSEGVYRYTLSQSGKDSDTVRLDRTTFEVEAVAVRGADGTPTVTLILNRAGDTHKLESSEVVFANTEASASLRISKTVTGAGDRSREWHFTLTLSDPVTGARGGVAFTKGEASFTLRSGESLIISGLFPDVAYTVSEEEANRDGYKTSVAGEEGVTRAGETVAVSFENYKGGVFASPGTGSSAAAALLLAASLILALTLILLAALRRRRDGED